MAKCLRYGNSFKIIISPDPNFQTLRRYYPLAFFSFFVERELDREGSN